MPVQKQEGKFSRPPTPAESWGSRRAKKGATMERRVYDTAKALQNCPYGGYVALVELYPRLRGYGKQTLGRVVRAVAQYMKLQGHSSWCRAHGQEGFWLGESVEELKRKEEKEREAAKREAIRAKQKPPGGKPYLATVRRVRDWIRSQPESITEVSAESILSVYGVKRLKSHQWPFMITDVLDSTVAHYWERNGLGGLRRKPH